jgi:hypothetical protein
MTFPPTGIITVEPGVIVRSEVKVMVFEGWGVGVGVGVAFGVLLTTTTTTSVVGTGVGTAVSMVVGTGVGAGVAVVTGAAGWDVHPASRIPINRIARTTKNFFMHLFLLFRYISIFNYCVPGSLDKRF